MKTVRKIIPVSLYDIPGVEEWLEEQANQGLFPLRLGSWAVFAPRGIPGTRFRLDAFGNKMGEGTEPTPAKLELYRAAGWEYICPIGRAYFLFYTTDPRAPELYTDYGSQGLSLDRLARQARRAKWSHILFPVLLIGLLLAALLWPASRYDLQPDRWARLPLILREPVVTYEGLFGIPSSFDSERNQAKRQFSLLAPVWYEVRQKGYGLQGGTQPNAFSPDPEGGKFRYSPSLDMTVFHLSLPALARSVAKAQMDLYRPVNLRWTYEEPDYPGVDFVILARPEDRGRQMAALGKGGKVAVFYYAGQEDLTGHLDVLAKMVQ